MEAKKLKIKSRWVKRMNIRRFEITFEWNKSLLLSNKAKNPRTIGLDKRNDDFFDRMTFADFDCP